MHRDSEGRVGGFNHVLKGFFLLGLRLRACGGFEAGDRASIEMWPASCSLFGSWRSRQSEADEAADGGF